MKTLEQPSVFQEVPSFCTDTDSAVPRSKTRIFIENMSKFSVCEVCKGNGEILEGNDFIECFDCHGRGLI